MGKVSHGNPFHREENSVESKKTLYIIYEGHTEEEYVNCLKNHKMLKPFINIEHIMKDGIDTNETDRIKMVKLAFDITRQYWYGTTNYRRYISQVLADFYYNLIKTNEIKDVDQFRESVRTFRDNLFKKYEGWGYVLTDPVPPDRKLYVDLSHECSHEFKLEYMMMNTDVLYPKPHPDNNKNVFIMFDRDYSEYFDHEKYKECLELCKKYNYKPLVSSPQFELWLLMHFPDASFNKPSFTENYGKQVENELGQHDYWANTIGKKHIGDERGEIYVSNISNAIKASQLEIFENDPIRLMDHAGTNLGEFFMNILKEDYL